MDAKYERLSAILEATGGALVAFSGGVDSTFLLKAAYRALGERAVALTAASPAVPPGELEAASAFAAALGCRHVVVESHELGNPDYAKNPSNRCFFCKDELYRLCRAEAERLGLGVVIDGTNLDDLKDHRPGLQAAHQWRVRHPLVEAAMTKEDIRRYSRALGLPTWDKPSSPCLSSRFPYGTEINLERLRRVAACELFLKELRFREFRVRYHGDLARIEVAQDEIERLFEKRTRDAVVERFKALGFKYVSLDLQGYRSGSLNEVLSRPTP
ncbi:MAG TPA: ATP-dependent sacrificial sulfur transferase LarE [candidate division Zixibacteria bacterium]|nr:ATP-dependent sacrificial sulfur transferase LarE [candidate division Zixibacteria bacterium]